MSVDLGALDPHGEEFVRDRDTLFDRLRREQPVAHSTAYGGFWILSRYADVRRALEDHATFSSAYPGRIAVPPTETGRVPLAPLEVDPPRHTSQLSLVAPWFGSRAVDPLVESLRAEVNALLVPLRAQGRLEAVAELALPVVSLALALHLRLPREDAHRWISWTDRIFATRVARPDLAREAALELHAYVAGLLQERRDQPRDDVFTALATGHVDGAPMPEQEAVGFGTNLLLAGRDATVDGIVNALVHLAQHPEQQEQLRARPDAVPRAVEELLRAYSPIHQLGRVTTCPVRIGDVDVPAGDSVAVCYGSANRDETVFPDAELVDLDRRGNRHLAFGAGVHRCLGAQLARLVLTVTLEQVLLRLPPLRLDPDRLPQPKPNGDTRGWLHAELVRASD